MPTVTLSPVFRQKFFDNAGAPLAGGKLFSYLATTTTKAATYTDSTGGSPNANPVILNFRGEADVWIEPNKGYKFVLAPSTDTDPPTNPIWTEDNIRSSQLLTLYGGVDTGGVNAYVLTFTANFTAYTDGIVIYWIPANTNTGPSTININGLGIINIVNPLGGALSAGQIPANVPATILIKGGQAYLVTAPFFGDGSATSPTIRFANAVAGFYRDAASGFVGLINNGASLGTFGSGTFTGTLTGMTGTVAASFAWVKVLGTVTMWLNTGASLTGTSNTTAMTLTGVPATIRPSISIQVPCMSLVDNSVFNMSGAAIVGVAGTITFNMASTSAVANRVSNSGAFTNVNNKGLGGDFCLIYALPGLPP